MAGTGRTAGRKKRGSGRRFVLALVGIFVLAMGVIARRTVGIGQARALRQLEERRDAMDAARVKLEAEIREASSRARLGPIVEQRLQMYVPADSQVIILPRPPQTHQP
jgi:cell division protein FtsL